MLEGAERVDKGMLVSGGTKERRAEIGAARSLRTKTRLIEAAARVIGLRGEDAATIDDFIRQAGVSRGTFYKHFATRHDLMVALWEHFGREPYKKTWLAYADVPDRAERVMIGVKHQLLRAMNNHAWGWLVLRIWIEEDAMYQDIQLLAHADIEAGRREGRFVFEDAKVACDLVFGAMMGATKALMSTPQPPYFIEEVCAMILCMLGVGISESRRIAALPIPQVPDIDPLR